MPDIQIPADDGSGGEMTAAEILAALLTVDGAGSGLDADLLDGLNPAGLPISTATQTALDLKAPSATCVIRHSDGTSTAYNAASDTDAARGTAMLAAVAAAVSGELIWLGVGTFLVTQEVLVPAGVSVQGSGKYVTTIKMTVSGVELFTLREGCEARDLTCWHEGNLDAILVDNTSSVKIENCVGIGTIALWVASTGTVIATGCEFVGRSTLNGASTLRACRLDALTTGSGSVTSLYACELPGLASVSTTTLTIAGAFVMVGGSVTLPSDNTATQAILTSSSSLSYLVGVRIAALSASGRCISKAGISSNLSIHGCLFSTVGATEINIAGTGSCTISESRYDTTKVSGTLLYGDALPILTAIKTVDGSGSGLDADLLDGHDAAYFAAADAALTALATGSDFVVFAGPTTSNKTFTLPDSNAVIAASASALTSGRVPYATTGGALIDSNNLQFNGSYLLVYDVGSGGIRVGADAANCGYYIRDGFQLVRSSAEVAAIFYNRFTFNSQSADIDFNIKGDTNANLFYLDASTDRIGIGTPTPTDLLDVNGTVVARGVSVRTGSPSIGTGRIATFGSVGSEYVGVWVAASAPTLRVWSFSSSGQGLGVYNSGSVLTHLLDGMSTTVFNEPGGDLDFRIEGDTDANCFTVDAGNDSIGSGVALGSHAASAKFQIDSTTKGFLPPRMTTTQRDAIASPAAGLMIYNSTTAKLNVYTTAWEAITSA